MCREKIFDYDRIDEWEPWIDGVVFPIAPANLAESIAESEPEFIEDAADTLFEIVDKEELVACLSNRLHDVQVRVYHGTRLSRAELHDIQENGLRSLRLTDRKDLLTEIFSDHPEWLAAKSNLDEVLSQLGPGCKAGLREDGYIHVCFSRRGLLSGCNHYLTHGAEVDGHVASMLFQNKELALKLLQSNREPYLISFLSDFDSAISAANPYGFNKSDTPSLMRQIIQSWAFKKYRPEFSSESLQDCTAARFTGPKPAQEIEKYELVSEILKVR
jgi:hypothetical protein